jgi:hypothetical protein
MVPTGCGKKDDFLGLWMKNRTNYGDVRKMPTSRKVRINRADGKIERTCDPPA